MTDFITSIDRDLLLDRDTEVNWEEISLAGTISAALKLSRRVKFTKKRAIKDWAAASNAPNYRWQTQFAICRAP